LPKRRPLEERFWEKVAVRGQSECWHWTACLGRKGYGKIGSGQREKPTVEAHIVSWELANGPRPAGMNVCHRCDTPACVNPSHLFLGTQADNQADMVSKGRQTLGEKNPMAKLTESDIRTIKALLGRGVMQRSIAVMFGVTDPTISNIKSGKTWSRVSQAKGPAPADGVLISS
jgi:hypothetical protein